MLALLTPLLPPMSPLQVQNIVGAIYRHLPSITEELASESLNKALQSLMGEHPREVVASLLQCSPTCTWYGALQPLGRLSHWERGPKTLLRAFSPAILQSIPADKAPRPHSVAVVMWKAIVSEPQSAKNVLQDLLNRLRNKSWRKMTTADDPRILSLAVGCWMSLQGCSQLSGATAFLPCPPQALTSAGAQEHFSFWVSSAGSTDDKQDLPRAHLPG